MNLSFKVNSIFYLAKFKITIYANPPARAAFQAEHHAVAGQIIVSADSWSVLQSLHFSSEHTFSDGYKRLDRMKSSHTSKIRKKNMMRQMHQNDMEDPKLESKIKQYITGAVLPNLNPAAPDDEKWGNELRKVCVMFVNLGIKEQQVSERSERALSKLSASV